MDPEKDRDARTGHVRADQTVMRLLTEVDELNLREDIASSAEIKFIALATEWDLLCANLVAVVHFPRTDAATIKSCFSQGEHLFLRFEEFDPDHCLRKLLRAGFPIEVPRDRTRAGLNDISRFSILAALFHDFGELHVRERIEGLVRGFER